MNRRLQLAAASAYAVLFMIGLILRSILSLPDISAMDEIISGKSVIPIRDLTGRLIYEYNSPTYGEQPKVSLDEMIAAYAAWYKAQQK